MARQYRVNLAAPLFYLLVHCLALLCENSILQPLVVKQWANSTILQRKVVCARLTGSPNYNTVKVIKWSEITMMVLFLLASLAAGVVALVFVFKWLFAALKKKDVRKSKKATLISFAVCVVCLVGTMVFSGSEEKPEMPTIAGSDATDIIVDLAETAGLEEDHTIDEDGSFTYTAQNLQYGYSIITGDSGEIASARFYDLNGGTDNFLAHCATLPYDDADIEAAQAWVTENLGTNAETKIGSANFELSVGTAGPILAIRADGIEEYLTNKALEGTE